jgi:hypothetical protein
MSNPEEMLVQLINSINKLSALVQNVNDAISKLSTQMAQLDSKIDGLGSAVDAVPEKRKAKKESAPPAEVVVQQPPAEYSSPALAEEEDTAGVSAAADAAFDAVSKKFKHITQMITPTSSCGNIGKMLEELRDEVETQVGMSPMLYELNSWVQRVSKMPEADILLPEVHSELIGKLDDWLTRVTKAIHLKYQDG